MEAVRQLELVASTCFDHLDWVKDSLEVCDVPALDSEEGVEAMRELAARLKLKEVRELVVTISNTLDLLEERNNKVHREGLLAELLDEDITEALGKARSQLDRLILTFNSTS